MIVDIHTHPVMIKEFVETDSVLAEAVRRVFGLYVSPQPLGNFLLQMDAAGVERAVLLPLDCLSTHGCRIFSNDQIAEIAGSNPRLIGFSSVDPHSTKAPAELERSVKSLGLAGLKLDPAVQEFRLDDQHHAYPIYAKCCELGVPVLLHVGLSWAPSGQAYYSCPMMLEKVIHDFPELQIIIAHFGWPWVGESVMLALKYPNVYLDTSINYSGTPVEALKHVLGSQVGLDVLERGLRKKTLFGSNYPRVDIKRMVQGVRALGLSSQAEAQIFYKNAGEILKLRKEKRG